MPKKIPYHLRYLAAEGFARLWTEAGMPREMADRLVLPLFTSMVDRTMVHLDFEKYDALGKELARAMFEGDANQIVTSARELQNNVVRDLGGDFVDFACTHWIIANAEEIAGWSQKAREMIPEMDIGEPTRFIPGKNGEEEFPPIWVVPPDKSNEPLK